MFQQVDDGPLQPVISGRYLDRFEMVGGSWRFSERTYRADLVGDLSNHLTSRLGL